MSESVVADFTTEVIPDAEDHGEPVTGRVLMSETRVVIATATERRTIPISSVFDLSYGTAPAELRRFFDTTVSVAYRDSSGRHVAHIEGEEDTVERFMDLLFKAILNGTEALITHPARVGGRITDSSAVPLRTVLRPGTVIFEGRRPVTIEVSTVIHFERLEREVRGTDRPVLSVRHMPEMTSKTTEIYLESDRVMNVLGRYLRIEYAQLREEFGSVDLGDHEVEALLGLYSGGDDASLAGMLGMVSNQVTMLLNGLVEKGMLEERSSGVELTPLGKLAVSQNIEQVNT